MKTSRKFYCLCPEEAARKLGYDYAYAQENENYWHNAQQEWSLILQNRFVSKAKINPRAVSGHKSHCSARAKWWAEVLDECKSRSVILSTITPTTDLAIVRSGRGLLEGSAEMVSCAI